MITKKLYYDNQYLTTFSSVIVERINIDGKPAVILEQTAFYPNSGGQPHDTGTLNNIPVIDVIENETHQILHVLERPLEAEQVEGKINWQRRFENMQRHTGQHLLSQTFIKICDAETVSMHLSEESSSIDVNKADISGETIKAVENLANQIIYENRSVRAHLVTQDEAQNFPLRKDLKVEEDIRILEIKDFDFSPCGGTHCAHTGEIGIVKVNRFESYKGGTRVYFACGWKALEDYQQKTDILRQLTEMLTSGEPFLVKKVEKMLEEAKTLHREQTNLTKQLLEYEAKALLADRELRGENLYVLTKIFEGRDQKELKFLAEQVLALSPKTIILFGGKTEGKASLMFLRSEDVSANMNELMKTACAVINGRGGGQPHQAQGGGTEVEKLAEALQRAQEAIF